jgi:hypothetical protein
MSARYDFTAKLWRHSASTGSWHFVTLPADLSAQIRTLAGGLVNAFGSVRVIARIGATSWKTSIFFDTRAGAFLLPLKADVRRKAGVSAGDEVSVGVEIDL